MNDVSKLIELYSSLSEEDLYMRFFIYHKVTQREVEEILSQRDHVTLLAFRDEKLVGEGSLYDNGEFSLVVRREHRRNGIGTTIVSSLISLAKDKGLHKVIFYTLPNNYPMIAIGRKLGFSLKFEEEEVEGIKVL